MSTIWATLMCLFQASRPIRKKKHDKQKTDSKPNGEKKIRTKNIKTDIKLLESTHLDHINTIRKKNLNTVGRQTVADYNRNKTSDDHMK